MEKDYLKEHLALMRVFISMFMAVAVLSAGLYVESGRQNEIYTVSMVLCLIGVVRLLKDYKDDTERLRQME